MIRRTSGGYVPVALALFFFCFGLRSGLSGQGGFGKGGHQTAWLPDYVAASNSGDDWHVKKDLSGLGAEVAADAQTADGTAKSTLSFHCTPGKGGTSSIEFIVLGATKIKGFGFDDFEGPDAPAAGTPLITFTAHRATGDLVVRSGASGYYTVSDEGFAFEISTMAGVRGKVTQLSDALIQGASGISIRIQDFKHPQKTIEAAFPTGGGRCRRRPGHAGLRKTLNRPWVSALVSTAFMHAFMHLFGNQRPSWK